MTVNTTSDRVHCKPWGLDGGLEAAGNQVTLRIGGKEIADLPNAKIITQRLKPGEAFTLRSGGGGGFGSPLERDPELVAHDVREGYVGRRAAEEAYGVAVTEDGAVDHTRTDALRRSRGAAVSA
jgi:N-methylhydantoinase B